MATNNLRAVQAPKVSNAPVQAKIKNVNGVLTITVNHGNMLFPPQSYTDRKTGETRMAKNGTVAKVGGFRPVHIGGGLYLSLYLGQGDEPQARNDGTFVIE